MPMIMATKTDKNIAMADIACGMAWTRMNQTNPMPKAITKLNLMVS